MAEKDDSAWVFDSLVGFLQGPIWSAPLLTFIEEKSLIFEPGTKDCKEYRDSYQEYKNLVDLLLGCYMEDMGISTEQFERACTLNKITRVSLQFQQVMTKKTINKFFLKSQVTLCRHNFQTLFEQIWAANDYEVFKRMMIQKNLELQLQALKLLEQKFGLTSSTSANDTSDDNSENLDDDEVPMEELLHVETQASIEKADVDVDNREEESMRQEHERLAAEYRNESNLFKEALRKSTADDSPILEEDEEAAELVDEQTSQEVLAGCKILPTSNEGFNIKPKKEANEVDVRKRQLYLKAQRDKLVALKKRTRSRRLQAADKAAATAAASARPSSARVFAEATVEGDLNKAHQATMTATVDPAVLQVRRALAARLKAEVVQK
ncbi:cilia- and flagella-associated protein 36 [Copidosoma floridanum]|uniref:cilia- and flagella-associated protein 36 n=1 Tax=Copidosoma floridanum TaxID=29053 RepID=UPI000C6FB080|nr:cilia- and flagella-associated protein 36 [Copidosoma floridanum]